MATGELVPEQKIGSYVLLGKLGAGGIGEVWKARDRRLNRVVALKFLSLVRPGSTPPQDLLREARAASALNHPNIITVFDVGENEGRPFLAMEFVEGETLRARLKRLPFPLDEALDIATQVAEGLAAAHHHGIVHRDLKPENILLRVDGYVKLLDFGLAKILPWGEKSTAEYSPTSGITESGAIVGTLTYMSPEQARALPVSPASDVFSFGIILYEMLTSEHPFRADTPMDTVSAILTRTPVSASTRAPSVPRELSEICARALAKEPGQRYSSAVELQEHLKRARAEERVSAPAEQAAPQVRHKPRWMQALGAALIAALLSVAGWYYRSPARSAETSAPVRSLAVMSFRTSPEDQRASTFAQDLPEELGSALTRTGMRVASRSSVLDLGSGAKAREVGAQLGVDAVLEGSVRSYGSKFKVHVELVNARSGFQIWAETFATEGEDLLSDEQKTAAEIANQLRQTLAAPR
jgi:serine/threonine protein kinase